MSDTTPRTTYEPLPLEVVADLNVASAALSAAMSEHGITAQQAQQDLAHAIRSLTEPEA